MVSSKEKISLILKDGRQARERLSWMSGEELAERLRKDYARGYVSQLREALPRLLPIAQFVHINKIHTVYPSVEYRRTPDGGHVFRQYTGIVMVEVRFSFIMIAKIGKYFYYANFFTYISQKTSMSSFCE